MTLYVTYINVPRDHTRVGNTIKKTWSIFMLVLCDGIQTEASK